MEQHNNKTRILWTKLKDGDVTAMGVLYDIYVDVLFAYGMQFSSNKNHVMDAIHDLFLNLYKYRLNLAETDNVSFYLFRSLKNNILKSQSKNLSYISFTVDPAHDDLSIEEQLCEKEFENERAYKLAQAITKLTTKQRKALFLRFTEERSYQEVASVMNVSIETARTIIYRAIKTLRRQL